VKLQSAKEADLIKGEQDGGMYASTIHGIRNTAHWIPALKRKACAISRPDKNGSHYMPASQQKWNFQKAKFQPYRIRAGHSLFAPIPHLLP